MFDELLMDYIRGFQRYDEQDSLRHMLQCFHTATQHQQLLLCQTVNSVNLWIAALKRWVRLSSKLSIDLPHASVSDWERICNEMSAFARQLTPINILTVNNFFNILLRVRDEQSRADFAEAIYEMLINNEAVTITALPDHMIDPQIVNVIPNIVIELYERRRLTAYKFDTLDRLYNLRTNMSIVDKVVNWWRNIPETVISREAVEAMNTYYQNHRFRYNFQYNMNCVTAAHSIHLLDSYRKTFITKLVDHAGRLSISDKMQANILKMKLLKQHMTLESTLNTLCSDKQIEGKTTVHDLFTVVLVLINRLDEKIREEALKRLTEELYDMKDKCFSGHINRLCIVLTGFIEEVTCIDIDKVVKEQLQKLLEECESKDDLLVAMVDYEYTPEQVQLIEQWKESVVKLIAEMYPKESESFHTSVKSVTQQQIVEMFGDSFD